jgi:phage shock protein A
MTDTIASRVTRVISGGFHALLDSMENAAPEAAMAQAIREVDQASDEVRAELGRVESVKHLASSSLNKLNTHNETLAGEIELAVAAGDEELARAGIARQVDIEDQIPVLQHSLHDAADRSRELEGYLVALVAKKREMEAALQDYIAAQAAARRAAPPAGASGGAPGSRAERAGDAFDRMLARQTGLKGLTAPLNPDAAKLRDLQELARKHRIDERLAALKAAKGGA